MPGASRSRSAGPAAGRRRHLLTRVLDAMRKTGDRKGCSAKQILNFLNNDASAKDAVDKARLVTVLKRGVQTGALAYRGGRYRPASKKAGATGWREICCRKRPAKWRAMCRRMFSRRCRKIRRRRSCRRRRPSCRRRRRSCRRRRRSCRRRRPSCRRRRRSCRRRRSTCRRRRRSCSRRRRPRRPICCPPPCCPGPTPPRRRRSSCRRRRRCSTDDQDPEQAAGTSHARGNSCPRSQQE